MSDDPRPAPEARRLAPLSVVATVGGAFLGAVLLVAAYAKILDPNTFVDLVRAEGLDFLLPARLVGVLALAVEIGLGLLLLLGVRRLPVLVAASALVVFFLALTGRTWWLAAHGHADATRSCGCFGHLVERTPKDAFLQDLLLLVPSLALAWLARPRAGGEPWPWRRVAGAAAGTGALLVFAGLAPGLPLDDWATRLRPGLDAAQVCAGQAPNRVCLGDVLPDLGEGRHLVVIADVEDPGLREHVEALNRLNRHALDGQGPRLWVITSAPLEAVQRFQLLTGAGFPVQHSAPAPLFRPLYRRLPRSFLVEGGRVTRTWSSLPPLGDGDRPSRG